MRVHACAVLVVALTLLASSACGAEEPDESSSTGAPASDSAASGTPDPTETGEGLEPSASSTPTDEPEETAPAEDAGTPEPTQTPEPPPSFTTRDDARDYFEDLLDGDIDWQEGKARKGRSRLIGIEEETFAIVELFGVGDAVDEVSYSVVFDGTDPDLNFDRALPMIRIAQEHVSEKAAMFVGDRLDLITTPDAMKESNKLRKFDGKFVGVFSIDMVGLVGTSISVGHPPFNSPFNSP